MISFFCEHRARYAVPLGVAVALVAFSSVAAERDEALDLESVLESVRLHFPMLRALQEESRARSYDLLSERGRFDLRLSADADWQPEGFYENRAGGVRLEAPTRLWGARFSGGYRIGAGDYPSYEGKALTDESGEVSIGVEVPLLRGGATDADRTSIARAEIAFRQMEPEIQLTWIETVRGASVAYWDWVAMGRRLEIAERLLAVADARQAQIAGRVERGAEPKIDLTDNQRLIVERRAALRGAQRDFEQAAIRLTLFLRDSAGRPRSATGMVLPEEFPLETVMEEAILTQDLAFAEAAHPILIPFTLERERLEVDLKLARNDTLPELGLRVEGAQDLGGANPGIDETGKLSADSRGSSEIRARLSFSLPVQMRQARGRVAALRARLSRLEARAQWAREKVRADVQQAVSALEAAFDQTVQARENVRLAEVLRSAEVRRFGLGRSNLIDVNIRERQAATAARELVDAQANYFRSLADYHARVGREPDIVHPTRIGLPEE